MRTLCLFLCCALLATPAAAQGLVPLKYNHPGLVVDLGVGLWAWPVPCDADGDGDFDLIVSCPDKPSNGVWLFENAAGDTKDNKFPVFKPARWLSSTVHYVTPSYIDGQLRVLTPGFEYPNFKQTGLEERVAVGVDAKFYKPIGNQPKGPKVRHNQWRYVDYDGDGALDLVVGIEDWSDYGWDDAWNAKGEWTNGPLHGFVLLHRNTGSTAAPAYAPPVKLAAAGQVIDVFGCPSPNFADFDTDGDLDLLCGEFLDGFTYFENIGNRQQPEYAAGRRLTNRRGAPLVMDLQMIVPVAFDWDRDGDFDLIVGDEDGRVALVENSGKLTSDRTPQFLPPRYFQQEADTLKCGALATPVGYDWDGDGDTDIVAGNTAGYLEFFQNLSGPRAAEPKWAAPVQLAAGGKTFRIQAGKHGSIQGPAEAKWGYTTLSIADWDGDGLPDIVYNSILGRVKWLKNIGTRTAPKLAAAQSIEVEWPQCDTMPPPKPAWTWWTPAPKSLLTQWRTTPVVYDANRDGLPDLIMLDPEGYLCWYERALCGRKRVLLPPQRAFVDKAGKPLQLNARTAGGSGRRKLCVTDWDGDGRFDLLLNSSNADFLKQTSYQTGVWTLENVGTLAKQNIEGHDVSPAVVDFNGDRIPDFLGGAEDGRLYYLPNPRSQPTTATTTTHLTAETGDKQIFRKVLRKAGDDGVKSYRIPGLATTPKGTLLAVFDIRHQGPADLPADVDVGLLRSTDDGESWQPLQVILDYDKHVPDARGNGVGDPSILVDRRTGTIFVAALWSQGDRAWHGSRPGLRPEETGQFVIVKSSDEGVTWSKPINITSQVKDPAWRLCFQGPGAGIQTRDGTLIFPAQFRAPDGAPHSCFIFSRDGGEHWSISPPAIPDKPPTSESQIAELEDGSLLLTMRDESRSGQRQWASWKWDAAKDREPVPRTGAWSKPWSVVPDPTCMASLCRHPHGELLFANPNSNRQRIALTVRSSTDGGRTWSEGSLLDPRGCMYSCLTVLKDGRVGILYEVGDTLTFARFPLEWVIKH